MGELGQGRWSDIAAHFPGRVGKQCRERWCNQLDPSIKTGKWSQEEEEALVAAHRRHSNRWSEIARELPGRPENSIKNHVRFVFVALDPLHTVNLAVERDPATQGCCRWPALGAQAIHAPRAQHWLEHLGSAQSAGWRVDKRHFWVTDASPQAGLSIPSAGPAKDHRHRHATRCGTRTGSYGCGYLDVRARRRSGTLHGQLCTAATVMGEAERRRATSALVAAGQRV